MLIPDYTTKFKKDLSQAQKRKLIQVSKVERKAGKRV
jgi:mRNA-degrading endonuclease YafQ of YafQ-DinJ toxin-antitoxin module